MVREVTLYHNPRCSNSRGALAILRERNIPHRVVEYLKNPLDSLRLLELTAMLDIPPGALVRSKEAEYKEAGLSGDSTPDEIIAAIAAHPKLMQRPVVVQGKRAIIARPPEVLQAWLEE